MHGSIAVSSDGSHGSTFRVHVRLRSYSGSPVQHVEPNATKILAGKHVLVVASSGANRDVFAKLLPTVNATVSCLSVARNADTLPSPVTAELLEGIDIAVAELQLIAALQALFQSQWRSRKMPLLIMPLTTSLQYDLLGVLTRLQLFIENTQVVALSAQARLGTNVQAVKSRITSLETRNGI